MLSGIAKAEVLSFVASQGSNGVGSAQLADALGYSTRGGASATLLRLHTQGKLRRRREGAAYVYTISPQGLTWLEYARRRRDRW
jgi:DNA-binding transcriptional regulator PaaX